MSKPVIGITTNLSNQGYVVPRTTLNETYIRAVQAAGGIPVLLPSAIQADMFADLFQAVDGFLLTGGVDINPLRYGAPIHPAVTELDLARDEMELKLVPRLLEAGKPFLAICRGIEVINVALGGTLYTHISDQLPNALHHTCYIGDLPRNLLSHSVQVQAGSRLADLLGAGEVWVNSLHHQGLRDLAPGLVAIAHASDGLVEAVEVQGHPFALAVQWHPEELIDQDGMLNLFKALVSASSPETVEAGR
jgi:putative glutamine amidotransferase